MKKLLLSLVICLLPAPLTAERLKLAAIDKTMTRVYDALFGTDPMASTPLTQEKATQWLTVMNIVSTYVNANDTNLFGIKDPILTEALNIIKKANESLLLALQKKDLIKNTEQNSDQLALPTIEQQMQTVIKELENGSFILKSKKNARTILITMAKKIEIIAQKLQKKFGITN